MITGPQLNTLLRIDSVWMALSVDEDGTEGVCAFMSNTGWMPLIAADEKRLADIRKLARQIAYSENRLVRIVRMTTREAVEEIDGRQ